MANRFWIDGPGNWSDTSHWSTTSGGAGGAAVPTSADDVFIDDGSLVDDGDTITLDIDASCHDFDATGVSNFDWNFDFGANELNIYGSIDVGFYIDNITFTTGSKLNFLSTSAGEIVETLGYELPDTDFNGVGGEWTDQSGIYGTGTTIRLLAGTLHLSSAACLHFSSTGSAVRTLDIDGANVDIEDGGDFTISGSNITLIEGISEISINGSGTFAGGGETYYNLRLFAQTGSISVTGANTFNLLALGNDGGGGTYTFPHSTTQTVSAFTARGSYATDVLLRSSQAGTQFTLSMASGLGLALFADLKDSNVTGGAAWRAPDATDNGNNTGWDYATYTFYWVGGTGSWSDAANHWATSSGGAPSANNLPTLVDNVLFDANSFSGSGQTVTSDMDIEFHDMDWSSINQNVNWNMNNWGISVYGSMIIISSGFNSVTATNFPGIGFFSNDAGEVINMRQLGGHTIGVVSGAGGFNSAQFVGSGEWTLQSDFIAKKVAGVLGSTISHQAGTLNTNGQTVITNHFYVSTTSTRVLNLGASTIQCSNSFQVLDTTNLTINPGTSTILLQLGNENVVNQEAVFDSKGITMYNLTLNQGTNGGRRAPHHIQGGHTTFTNNVTIGNGNNGNAGNYMVLHNNITINGALVITQASSIVALNRKLIRSDILGTQRTITAAAFTATGSSTTGTGGCDFQDINCAGAATWSASSMIGDCGGNTGLTPTAPTTCYWVGGTGDWYETHWATSSGGSATDRFPLPQDTAIFDANSFSADTQVVGMSAYRLCKNLTITTTRPIVFRISLEKSSGFNFVNDNTIFGNLTLSAQCIFGRRTGGATNIAQVLYWENRAPATITCNGATVHCRMFVRSFGTTLTLADALDMTKTTTGCQGGIYLENGTFDANDKNVTTAFLTDHTYTAGNAHGVDMGIGQWTLKGDGIFRRTGVYLQPGDPEDLTYAGTPDLLFNAQYDSNSARLYTYGNTFDDVTFLQNGEMQGDNTMDVLTFTAGFDYSSGNRQTLNDLVANGTNGNEIGITGNFFSETNQLVNYCVIENSEVGDSIWCAMNSQNDGGNSGWLFECESEFVPRGPGQVIPTGNSEPNYGISRTDPIRPKLNM